MLPGKINVLLQLAYGLVPVVLSPHRANLMNVLIAFDKFKDPLSAPHACEVASEALTGLQGNWTLDQAPLTDGGEGFAEILTHAAGGRMESVNVVGPRGEPVIAKFGWVPVSNIPASARRLLTLLPAGNDGHVAVVEMAAASGLALIPEALRDPWQTTSFGTGQLLRAASKAGACAIVLGVGGSATNDLGAGALAALGVHFDGIDQYPVPAAWERVQRIEGRILPGLPPIHIACDVTNPLLGPTGCTAIYGPQKGLRAPNVERMEQTAFAMAERLCGHFGRETALTQHPGHGAAGGIPFGLSCATPTLLMPGFEFVSAWLDLDARRAKADLVITGEGAFDASSLNGKGPGAIALRALELGKKVHLFAGRVSGTAWPGVALHAITPDGMPLPEALESAPRLLFEAVLRTFSTEG